MYMFTIQYKYDNLSYLTIQKLNIDLAQQY